MMNDLAICKRIAEIKGFTSIRVNRVNVEVNVGDWDLPVWEIYNPLNNDDILSKLIVEYLVPRWTGMSSKAILLAIIEAHNEQVQ